MKPALTPHSHSHAFRARCRAMIRRELAAGASCAETAQKWGYSEIWIRQIAKQGGVARPRGRPPGLMAWPECPPEQRRRYRYLVNEKGLPHADARRVIEERAL